MEPNEVLVGIRFPTWNGRHGFAVEEFARRHGDFAIAGAVVGMQLAGDDRVQRCAIGLLGLGSTPLRASSAETEALGRPVSEIDPHELGAQAMTGLDDVPSDLQGSAAYRQRVGAAMVARAWEAARNEARGEANHG
jgi:carbon-monoxide dehydrogenase medium subunit